MSDNPAAKRKLTVKEALARWGEVGGVGDRGALEDDGEDDEWEGSEGDAREDEGEELDPDEVMKARMEEIEELERRVYELIDVEECWRSTGKALYRSEVGRRAQEGGHLQEQARGEGLPAEELEGRHRGAVRFDAPAGAREAGHREGDEGRGQDGVD